MIPIMSPKLSDSTAEEMLRQRMRENDLDQLGVARVAGKSRTWVGNQLFANPLKTLWTMYLSEPQTLRALSKAFGYENEYTLLIALGLFDTETITNLAQHIDVSRTAAFPLNPNAEPASLTVKIPIYGTVGAGLKKIHAHDHPSEFVEFDMRELPKAVDVAKLFILVVNGDSMSDEFVTRQIPHGSKILVESDAIPTDGKIVVAWIPQLETGVVKQYFSKGEDTLLRSYKVGGPTFWASQYPDMVLEGVVRRVIWEP